MKPFKALIVPLDAPTVPGQPPQPGHDLPLFPFHPIVVPPGGVWPGEPPSGSGDRPNQDLPLFPFHPIVVPPGGSYPKPPEPPDPNAPHPDQTLPGDLPVDPTEPPVDPNAPTPSNPINLPPSDSGYWIFVYILGLGWVWIAVPPSYKPPTEAKKK
jgi:hypothetical protein